MKKVKRDRPLTCEESPDLIRKEESIFSCSRIHRGERSDHCGTGEQRAGRFLGGKSAGDRCTDIDHEGSGRHRQDRHMELEPCGHGLRGL